MNFAIVELGVENGEHIVLTKYFNVGPPELLEHFLRSLGRVSLSDKVH